MTILSDEKKKLYELIQKRLDKAKKNGVVIETLPYKRRVRIHLRKGAPSAK